MYRYVLLLFAFIIPFFAVTQSYKYENFKFESDSQRIKLNEEEKKESYIILKDFRAFEYLYDEYDKFVKFDTRYRKVRVNDDKAIEMFNKVYISLKNVTEIIDIQARSITKDGKITEVDKNNIKEVENLDDSGEDYSSYKIFAIEGLEVGSDLEYFYTLKKEVTFCGCGRLTFQTNGIVKNIDFELISPKNIIFMVKSYNGTPEPIEDTLDDGRRIISISIDSIPGLDDELYSARKANLMKIEYKFRNNIDRSKAESLTWADFAKRYYASIYNFNPKANKKIKKTLSGLEINSLSIDEKINEIENYLKSHYIIKSAATGENIADIDFILNNKYTSNLGMTKLYAAFFTIAGIKHYVGMTSDRYDTKFDKDFKTWNFLEEFLIYFPETDNYLAPTEISARYGIIPYEWTYNYGLFIKPIEIGEFKTGVPKVLFIPVLDYEKTFNNMEMDIKFSEEISQATIDLKYFFGGHTSFQTVFDFFTDKQKDDLTDQFMKSIGEDTEIISKDVLNTGKDISPLDKPFIVQGEIKIKSVIEKAGDNYLFKIGNLIGEQVEMYQEKERQLDVEIEFPHYYLREITFTVPEGYTVNGLENLKINFEYGTDVKKTMGFKSDYEVIDDKVKVTINEYYAEIFYPIAQFEEFRNVINAAADFNKITLVFEKK